MMDRSLRLLTMAVLVTITAACSSSPTPGASPTPTPSFTTKASGTLSIGSDIPYAPFEYPKKSGEGYTGFDIELIEAMAAKLDLTVDVVVSPFNTIFTSLAAGKFDIVVSAVTAYAPEGSPAADTVAERRQIVSFTDPYYQSLQSLTVNTKRTPDLTSIDGLVAGDKVGVQRGTTGQSWAKQNLGAKGIEIVTFPQAPAMFTALDAGQLRAVVNDLPVSQDAVKDKPNLVVTEQIDTGEEYAIAVNKENAGLLEALNVALGEVIADGTYGTLFAKYFPDQQPPPFAAS